MLITCLVTQYIFYRICFYLHTILWNIFSTLELIICIHDNVLSLQNWSRDQVFVLFSGENGKILYLSSAKLYRMY